MSNSIVNQIRKLPIQNPAKAVLWVLADIADDSGFSYPSQATLALECGVTDRTIRNCLKTLESCGVLSVDRSDSRHTKYIVTPEKYTQPEQCSGTSFRSDDNDNRNDVPVHRNIVPNKRNIVPVSRNDVPPNHQLTPINHQLTPSSVTAHEATVEKKPTPKTEKPKAEKTGLTVVQMIEFLPDLSTVVAADYLQFRKAKNAPLTATAWLFIAKEITKAAAHGYSPDDALAEAMAANWQGVKSDWLANRNKPKNAPTAPVAAKNKWADFGKDLDLKTVGEKNVIEFSAVRHA